MRTVFLFATILLLSCEKEVIKDDPDTMETDTSYRYIVLGDLSDMRTISYDTIISGSYNEVEVFYIDINQDNKDDIQLRSIKWGSLSVGEVPTSRLWCLHDSVKINGYFENDTTFRHKYSMVGHWTDTTHDILNYTIYTCHRMDENDTIIRINKDVFKASAMDKNELIYLTDTFNTDSLTLAESSYANPPDIEGYGQDTVFYNYTVFDKVCNKFPADKFQYIGFKIHQNNTEKLGWIKISISHNYKISILESAIQK